MKRLIFFFIAFSLIVIKASADEDAIIYGHVLNTENKPLFPAKVSLIGKKVSRIKFSDKRGFYKFNFLPSGDYILKCEFRNYQTSTKKIFISPSSILNIDVILRTEIDKEHSISGQPLIDYSSTKIGSLMDKLNFEELPVSRNIWSILENHEPCAVTNRIDVGGFWNGIPAFFSSRGSCSWTQNAFLLDGMNITDPYQPGLPVFYPDFDSFDLMEVVNASHPIEYLSPGAYINLIPKEGVKDFRGKFQLYYASQITQDTNITSKLREEGINEVNRFNYYWDLNFNLSGPLLKNKIFFFTSWTTNLLSRKIAGFSPPNEINLYSGFLNITYRSLKSKLNFLWTGQSIKLPTENARKNIPFSSTNNAKKKYAVYQIKWEKKIGEDMLFNLGINRANGYVDSRFQELVSEQSGIELFHDKYYGIAPFQRLLKFNNLSFRTYLLKITYFSNWLDKFKIGINLQRKKYNLDLTVFDNVHLQFFEGKSFGVIKYNTPILVEGEIYDLSLFSENTICFKNGLSAYIGLNLSISKGILPGEDFNNARIDWINFAPRFGLVIPLSKTKETAIKIGLSRFYWQFPLSYLEYGNPNSLGGELYRWYDFNLDSQYQFGEEGEILRVLGPYYSAIDENIKRPYTNELSISFIHDFAHKLKLRISGFLRYNRDLIETVNIGVPFSSYYPVKIHDIGDDYIEGTRDDRIYIVFNQDKETLGKDFFLLTNPDNYNSKYYGLDILFLQKFSDRWQFYFSFTATKAIGLASPGNDEFTNDQGVIGSLFDDPNTLINTRSRFNFDRAFVGKLGFNINLPHGFHLSGVVKYYDGRPFARRLIIKGLNQGPIFIMAGLRGHERDGKMRTEYNLTADLRLEKRIKIKNTYLRLIFDIFNLTNANLATREYDLTGYQFPLRYATEIQSPRVARLGIVYEF
ncbi:carboxypeptidase-like regulatory domain-containing protein [Candidatus Aminicenantes bacterium AC-335-K20]|jgi:hypothetical protein|nr:carboxypeptidase-like regulatory domain-containing protein [SCandidatus Aminicenantes bacterium Aminicenantia_JdfR_composite]MCP2605499.1 carboxypeptidase-like regulatory domain-containing protein [Candidatus Aminicenantes bacterium AC-335-O07]MCP2619176.1 carboxypeptidase-like regulatory domain-containing protein [Candidatus Aminicenantes bacterium AC-335-K20]MCP2620643.1 carboxypeptidase-like regulatory domain-containing protein [Candidatus Aminicenantes bacterium AC-334-E05]